MEIIDIPNEELVQQTVKVYNPSIVTHNDRTYLLARYEPSRDFYTEIGITELGGDLRPLKKLRRINLPRYSSRVITVDDPRAFVWNKMLWFAMNQGSLPENWKWYNKVALCSTDPEGHPGKWIYPDYGIPGQEKNWAPFTDGNLLYMVYSIKPLKIILYDPHYKIFNEAPTEEKPFSFDVGTPSGGTPLLKIRNEYVGFFHSYTVNKKNMRTYHMGYFAINDKPPFHITQISKSPLMTAELNPSHDLRGEECKWRPNCIYPCGFIEKDGKVVVSYGWQDCRCKLAVYDWDEVLDNTEIPLKKGKK